MARAQQSAMPVIGYLNGASSQSYANVLIAFRHGLEEVGFVEGQSIAIEYRWAQNENDRLPALAAELISRRVTVIAMTGTPSAFAAKAATTTIPIVFEILFDPVAVGLVPSLNRPGGNLTGVTNLGVEVGSKQKELLHELVPTATAIALRVNPTHPLPRLYRMKVGKQPASWGCNSMFCMRAPKTTSILFSQPWPRSRQSCS